jgi:hypothetical protein
MNVGITAHYIDEDFKLCQHLVAFEPFPGRHTGARMAAIVFDVLQDFDLCEKLYCITTDNASNNDTMAFELCDLLLGIGVDWDYSTKHIYCLAHVINIVVGDFIDALKTDSEHPFKVTLNKIRAVATASRRSTLRWERFKEACEASQLSTLTIPYDIEVRWNSTYRMLERAVYLRKAVDKFVTETFDDDEDVHKLSDAEWEMAEVLVMVLMPFWRCTMRFEGSETDSEIDYVFWAYETMFNFVDDLKTALQGRGSLARLSYARYLLDAVNTMEITLQAYYNKQTVLPTVYVDAMILNPRCKLALLEKETWGDQDADVYSSECRKRFVQMYHEDPESSTLRSISPSTTGTSTASSSTSNSTNKRPAPHHDDEFLAALSKRARTMLDYDRYISTPNDINIESPLTWWRANWKMYPELAKMVRDVLAVPATGCSIERQFSISGRVATWTRMRLGIQTISDSMIYKSYLKWRSENTGDHRHMVNEIVDDGSVIPDDVETGVPKEWSDGWWKERVKISVSDKTLKKFARIG